MVIKEVINGGGGGGKTAAGEVNTLEAKVVL